ncbi:unnamed protein product, partial [marine sediment metagenome]
EAIIHAMMVDPLSAAVCSPEEIRKMAEELFKAEKSYIPKWCQKPKTKKIKIKRRKYTKKRKVVIEEVSSMSARGKKK